MGYLGFFAICALLFVCQIAAAAEQEIAKRIYSHLLINDISNAVAEAEQGLQNYQQSQIIHQAYLKALAASGDEVKTIAEFERLPKEAMRENERRHVIENLAWGVLGKCERSPQIPIRSLALIGAAYTQDVRAVPIITRAMRDSNSMIRAIAVQLALHYGDRALQQEIGRMIREEKVWFVRLEAIKAVGVLRLVSLREELKSLIASPLALEEEKAAACISLVRIYDGVSSAEINQLMHSSRGGLRQLACHLIAYFDAKEEIPGLRMLLNDASSEVRRQASYSLGLLQASLDIKAVDILLKDPSPEVAITGAWYAILQDHPDGLDKILMWLNNPHADLRRFAARALGSTGTKGVDLAMREMQQHPDPYVRVNLAIGLLGQRKNVEAACEEIYSFFCAQKDVLWMWDTQWQFHVLAPSSLAHSHQVANYPAVVDQFVRLDILSMLSVLHYSQAQEAVKLFLKNSHWGVSGTAAAALLEEGDENAMHLVRGLLENEDATIRVQAALILALLGSDPVGLGVLLDSYAESDREVKMQIIEALGKIGSGDSIPFLLDVLKEPFQFLRVVAAAALIQILHH